MGVWRNQNRQSEQLFEILRHYMRELFLVGNWQGVVNKEKEQINKEIKSVNIGYLDEAIVISVSKSFQLTRGGGGGGPSHPPDRFKIWGKKCSQFIKIMFLIWFIVFGPFFKLYEGIIILNTKTKNLVYQIIDKKIPYLKLGTQEVKQ